MAPERPALIGLDPLRNLHGAEENSSTEMRSVLRALGAIRELCGCALAVVHHSAKSGGADSRTAGARMRGSSAIDGYRDGLISLEETEKGDAGDEITNQVVVDLKAARARGGSRSPCRSRTTSRARRSARAGSAARRRSKKSKRREAADEPKVTSKEQVAKAALEYFRKRHAGAVKAGQPPAFARGTMVGDLHCPHERERGHGEARAGLA
jgi:hypothetical protein